MRIHHHLFKPLALVALLILGVTGTCFAQSRCNIIAVAATESGDGVVHIPPNPNAFAMSTTNVGSTCNITVSTITLVNGIPSGSGNLDVTLCQTNPQNATCFNPGSPAPTVKVFPFDAHEQPTFSAFVLATGTIHPNTEVCVLFVDSGGNIDGQVCVPVKSP